MATLTGNITADKIMQRLHDYVAATANGSIVWHDGNNPTYTDPADQSTHVVIPDADLGPNASGITTSTAASRSGQPITASGIAELLTTETARYTRIRKVNAILRVTGGGGNRPAGPVQGGRGDVYDETAVAFGQGSTIVGVAITEPAPASYGIANDQSISVTSLQNYMVALRTAYTTSRDNTLEYVTSVCHASCHASCHSSRSRR